MYQAKAAHGGYSVYTPRRDLHNARRLALASDLRSAIEHDGLVVHYQPKADVRSGRITGVEALVRWQHPQFGLVAPDEFISLAEHTGLIGRLTDHVLKTALRQCQAWHRIGFAVSVAVNLSVRNLVDKDLPGRIADLLHEIGLPANMLTLEITESTIMADPARTLEILHQLAAMGITLAIDDFGTGYSSLSYLKRLPVHEVKIDKSFVHDMASDGDDQTIVRSVIDLARNLHLAVVAEGVEDARTWDRLAELGCDTIQGFYLSKPKPASRLTHEFLVRGSNVDQWVDTRGTVSGTPTSTPAPGPALRVLRS
jgi:diguanylate cyclase